MRKEKIAAEKYMKKFNTNCPFQIARELGVDIQFERLKDTLGYFSSYKRMKTIHINNELTESMKIFVCAHELGHVIWHPTTNTSFLQKHTLFSVSKIELEANRFAIELLLPDSLLREYPTLSLSQLATMHGVPQELTHLKEW